MAERLEPSVRRARILDTAMAMIAEEGYRGLTLRKLARRCDMSAPGLMHHFPDLPTLLLAILQLRDERTTRELHIRPQSDARSVLAGVVEGIIADPAGAQLFAVLQAEALEPAHPAHDYFRKRAARLIEETTPWLAQEFADPGALAAQLFAVMDGLQMHYLQSPDSFDIAAHWRAIAEALFAKAAPRVST